MPKTTRETDILRMETSSPKQYLGFGIAPQTRQGWRRMPASEPRLVDPSAREAPARQAAYELDTTRRGELPAKNARAATNSAVLISLLSIGNRKSAIFRP
jgi:hypothetical protein